MRDSCVPTQRMRSGYTEGMNTKHQMSRAIAWALALGILCAGCGSGKTPSNQLNADLAPFSNTRAQAIAMVTHGKRTLDPQSINQLMVSYTELEEKSNAYAGFLTESATVDSFDPGKNDDYASAMRQAINAFNISYVSLESRSLAPNRTANMWLSAAWVPSFAQHAQAYWNQYHGLADSPKSVAMAEQIKRQTVYPNFEDIATESVRAGQ